MNSEVRSPHSIMDHSLSVVPLLEVITLVLLVSGMDPWSEDHLTHELSLFETLVNEQVIFLVHGSMASLT